MRKRKFFLIISFLILSFILLQLNKPLSQIKVNKDKNLAYFFREALFWEKLKGGRVRCELCPHYCLLEEGERGNCRVRFNYKGKLYSLVWGFPIVLCVDDPIEKKPLFHVLPSAKTLSLATAGCNLRCIFCQNWAISQAATEAIKDWRKESYFVSPETVVSTALKHKLPTIVFTYTEPTVFYEYMLDIAKLAKKAGILVGMHSCGYINSAPLIKLAKLLDFANIDLKGFSSEFYTSMGSGKLEPVLNAIKILKKEGVWIEITNLIIPTVNDSDKELKELATWVKDNLGSTTPLHFSRFFPHHRLTELPPTSEKTLYKAAKIAQNVGLKYVYIGNLWGNPYEDTYCHKCNRLIIDRKGYEIIKMNLEIKKGRAYCAYCKTPIPGIFLQNKKE